MYGATKKGKRALAVPAVKHEKNFVVHEVQPSDTLLGLAVKYQVPVLEIKKENKLWKDEDISAHKTLVIPKDKVLQKQEEAELQQQRTHCLEGFSRKTGCEDSEVVTRYLEASCWNVTKAIQNYQRDQEKEENRKKFLEENPNWLPDPNAPLDSSDAISVAARVKARGGMGHDNRDGTKNAAASGLTKKGPENLAEALWNTFIDLKESFTLDRIVLG